MPGAQAWALKGEGTGGGAWGSSALKQKQCYHTKWGRENGGGQGDQNRYETVV